MTSRPQVSKQSDVPPVTPSVYLNLLGVIPDRHGAGIGSALLRSVLDVAARRAEPAFLEATSPRTRALFERHGFTAVEELRTATAHPCGPCGGHRTDSETGRCMKRTERFRDIASWV